MKDEPLTPPLVILDRAEPITAFLICWELQEYSGEWWAWVAWIRERRGESFKHLVSVPAAGLRQVEPAEAYRQVPRRVHCRDGVIRPWRPR